jgi:hypothetical protein
MHPTPLASDWGNSPENPLGFAASEHKAQLGCLDSGTGALPELIMVQRGLTIISKRREFISGGKRSS